MIQEYNECWDDNEAVLRKIIRFKEEEIINLKVKLKKITDKKRKEQTDELLNELDLKPVNDK
tara:strand:+ start:240 stop:425 length:186 start_codon:yes stop_codon:yes gene_type:complete